MDIKIAKYTEIEQEFSRLLKDEKNRWTEMYRLLDVVEKNQLWRSAGQRSFTAWVKDIALKNHVHESLIWQRKKAGAVFAGYVSRTEARGEAAPDPTEIAIPSESLELIAKIAKNNPVLVDNLINKAIDGEMTRDDLRQAWQSSRADQASRHDTTINNDNKKDSKSARVIEEQTVATDIVTALISSRGRWIKQPEAEQATRRIGDTAPKYRVLTEFAVRTGSSRSARRIDALAVENMTTGGDNYNLRLHAIEIKVSESDLKSDHKVTEYCDFVDYTWLAVPPHLVATAREIKPHTFGLLSVFKPPDGIHVCEVADAATHAPGIARIDTLQTALIKLL